MNAASDNEADTQAKQHCENRKTKKGMKGQCVLVVVDNAVVDSSLNPEAFSAYQKAFFSH